MKVISSEKNRVVLELNTQEFTDIASAVSSIREEYEILDKAMLDVPLERVESLDESFSDALSEANRRSENIVANAPIPATR